MIPRVSIASPNQSLSSFCCSPTLRPQMQSISAKYEPEVKILSHGNPRKNAMRSMRDAQKNVESLHSLLQSVFLAPPSYPHRCAQHNPLFCPPTLRQEALLAVWMPVENF
jgi:hypothetical protein